MPRGRGGRFGPPKRRDFSSAPADGNKTKLGILSEDIMSYYRNVSTSLENGFDEEGSLKDDFLTNVYATLKDEGVQVAQNQTVSRILEVLFAHSQPHHMIELFCCFCKELTIVTFDRFASHVFQSLIQYLPAMYEVDAENKQTEPKGNLKTAISQLCQFMESYMRDVMTHTYGSHVLRSLLEALGGVHVKDEVVRSRVSRTQRRDNVTTNLKERTLGKALSRDYKTSFETLKEKLLRLCNYEDHLSDPNYCPVLQTVLLILHKTWPAEFEDLVQTIIQKTCITPNLEETSTDDVSSKLPDIVQNEVGSYLIELVISLASGSQLRRLYDQIFKGKLIYFAVHPIANYVLQKLLSAVSDAQMLEELLADISQYMEDILAVNHIGIVTKLAEACRRTDVGQESFLKSVMSAFHCLEPADRQLKLVPLVASMQTYEIFHPTQDQDTEMSSKSESKSSLLRTVNIHGSLLLQQLLQFTQPKLVVSSLLDLSPVELMGLCCDRCGSHIIDVFFQSQTIHDKHKNAFLKKLEGTYVNIACNRNGSRCLENIWKGSSVKQRITIAEELTQSEERLESDQWGRFLYRNFAIVKFSQRRKEWMEIQGASMKRQQLLSDILQGNASRKNQKKKNKKTVAEDTVTSMSDSDEVKRKRKTDDSVVEQNFTADGQVQEGVVDTKPTKKKAKLAKISDATVAEPDNPGQPSSDTSPKKRKRNKEKKRKIRNAEQVEQPSGGISEHGEKDLFETAADEVGAKKKKKDKLKRVKLDTDVVHDEETTVVKTKHEKLNVEGSKFEKKGKLKKLKKIKG